MTRDEFDALFQRMKSTVGEDSAHVGGALRYISESDVVAATQAVRLGRHVSLARDIETRQVADNPEPARHEMTGARGDHHLAHGLDFATDSFAMNIHGDANSHIDALCHVIYESKLYDDTPVDVLTSNGATSLAIDVANNGIVGRGVLLDIPRLRGQPWLEPGDNVTVEDLRAAEEAQRVDVHPGDLLFVRVGHSRRRKRLGPWDAAHARAGLHPTALEFLAERKVAVLGGDSNNDSAPSVTEGVDFPVHVLALNALGVHLLDYLQFEDLVAICEEQSRWAFLAMIAPLRLPAATGSPINPIAIL
jgi:kynurenine formamidase